MSLFDTPSPAPAPGLTVYRDLIETHPTEIALFAAKHDYEELLKLTAEHAVKLPLSTVVPLLPERLILPWVSCSAYREGT